MFFSFSYGSIRNVNNVIVIKCIFRKCITENIVIRGEEDNLVFLKFPKLKGIPDLVGFSYECMCDRSSGFAQYVYQNKTKFGGRCLEEATKVAKEDRENEVFANLLNYSKLPTYIMPERIYYDCHREVEGKASETGGGVEARFSVKINGSNSRKHCFGHAGTMANGQVIDKFHSTPNPVDGGYNVPKGGIYIGDFKYNESIKIKFDVWEDDECGGFWEYSEACYFDDDDDYPDVEQTTTVGDKLIATREFNSGCPDIKFTIYQGFVTFYEHGNYGGKRMSFRVENCSNISDYKLGNDAISSMKIPPGYKVIAYDDDDYRGTTRTYRGNVPSLSTLNDKITSFKIMLDF